MSQIERYRRLRLLIKRLNKERKRQASKIDILCNDLIGAQREFVRRLNNIGFAAHFYKDLLGTADLRTLLIRAGRLIKEELPGAQISFFLRQPEGGELRALEADKASGTEDHRLEDCFTPELVESICKLNRPCTVDDLFGMGLEANLKGLNKISLATIPLSDLGRPLGFVLISRAAPHSLRSEELEKVGLITCGLSRSIRGCNVPLHSRDRA
jgi:hypothetical protein